MKQRRENQNPRAALMEIRKEFPFPIHSCLVFNYTCRTQVLVNLPRSDIGNGMDNNQIEERPITHEIKKNLLDSIYSLPNKFRTEN